MAGTRYGAKRRERRVRERAVAGGVEWVAVPATHVAAALAVGTGAPLVLVGPGRYRIEVREGFQPGTLARLLDTLEGVGCSRFPRG